MPDAADVDSVRFDAKVALTIQVLAGIKLEIPPPSPAASFPTTVLLPSWSSAKLAIPPPVLSATLSDSVEAVTVTDPESLYKPPPSPWARFPAIVTRSSERVPPVWSMPPPKTGALPLAIVSNDSVTVPPETIKTESSPRPSTTTSWLARPDPSIEMLRLIRTFSG
jgi:hypothetical protein